MQCARYHWTFAKNLCNCFITGLQQKLQTNMKALCLAFLKIRSPVCCAISLCESMVDKIVLQVRLELTTSAYLRICHISTAR